MCISSIIDARDFQRTTLKKKKKNYKITSLISIKDFFVHRIISKTRFQLHTIEYFQNFITDNNR